MKKFLKITAFVVAGLFVAVTAGGFLLPRKMRVSRSITVGAPPEAIYPLIANLKDGWAQWSPFGPAVYQNLKMEYSGPAEGVGAVQRWDSPDSGDGYLRITRADPARGVEMELGMMQETYKATGSLLCEPATDGTRVTWTDEFDYGNNPYRRYMSLIIGGALEQSFDQGLTALKKKVEERVAVVR
jgi:carbon monoxide dehydrogenase subunit G